MDSDSDLDSDPQLRAAASSFKKAQERVPELEMKITNRIPSKQEPRGRSPIPAQAPPKASKPAQEITTKPRAPSKEAPKQPGKRDLKRAAQEIPSWNPEAEPQPAKPSRHHQPSKVRVKTETQDPRRSIKAEPIPAYLPSDPSGPEVIVVDDDIVFSSTGAVNLKSQSRDVQHVLQLAIDYFFGFLLFLCAYPNPQKKAEYAADALINAASDLELLEIEEHIRTDPDYKAGLASVLYGRVSSFRGKVKTVAAAAIHGQYSVQHECAALVTHLTTGQRYIYPLRPGKIDPRTKVPGHVRITKNKQYLHPAVAAVASHFFKGSNCVADRLEAMFVTNPNGKLQAPNAMVALASTALYSALDDFASGELKISSFDSSRVQDVYDVHMLLLKTMERDSPLQYQEHMETIFNTASRGSSVSKKTSIGRTLLQQEALAMMAADDPD
ncbi:hypothetical protein C8J57DRAFT_1479067 [Mycena rebaudengoi]|nr:hypothetical protein C8J57DRAFT_1479067 [Mycena rebaudengoi]